MIRLAVVAGLVASFGSVSTHPIDEDHLHRRLLFPSPAPPTDTYDYIVVGGGTSGMTLAARLSENKDVTVAVLEAGIDYRSNLVNQQLVDTPGYDTFGVGASPSDWYVVRPSPLSSTHLYYGRVSGPKDASSTADLCFTFCGLLPTS